MTKYIPHYCLEGTGPTTLVFLHGLGGDQTNWRPQFDAFAPEYRCLAWTLPGYASSPGMEVMTWENLSDALAATLNDAEIETATVIGLSMGGYIAQQFAADHEDRVDALVLAATSAQFGRGSKSFAEKFLAARLKPLDDGSTPADLAPAVAKSLLSKDASPDAIENCVTSMSGISAYSYRQALKCLVTWNMAPFLNEIVAPTLCLAGADDATAPVAALQALADGLPDASLAVIDNCQHLMNLDRPDEFNRLVREFLVANSQRRLRPAGS